MNFTTILRNLVPAATVSLVAMAQTPTMQDRPAVVFRVEVVSKTIKAINYHHRQGSTLVNLEPSSFAPRAKGEIKVDSKTGATKVDAYVEKMPPSEALPEGYLTYVLWAITPEGRPENLGELMLDGDHARLQAATELQSFGLIVTAEPYYAVTKPSDFIVMEGVVGKKTTGTIMPVDAKYELVARGNYWQQLPPADRTQIRQGRNMPLDLLEARHAMAVARAAGAERYAADTIQKANVDLYNAESFHRSSQDKKKVQTLARHVTQLAEDARLISVRRANEEMLANERADNQRRAAELQRNAENEAKRRKEADLQAKQAEQQASEEARKRMIAEQESQQQKAQAEAAQRKTAEIQAQNAAAMADKERQLAIEAERARASAAEAELERVKKQAVEAEAARAREAAANAERKSQELEEQARTAREAAQRAEDERIRTRAELARQLNIVLATRESARGLIVNMSDVLFDTGRHTLKPGAREKLAKVAGILLTHPGLKIEVEGHTDSTGGPSINQPLSEKRAQSVCDYLVSQGVDRNSVTSRGLGDQVPVADNSSAAGRQANRRVELVVSGPMLTSRSTVSITTHNPGQ